MPLLEMMGLCLSTVGQLPQQMTMIKLICREREKEGGRERETEREQRQEERRNSIESRKERWIERENEEREGVIEQMRVEREKR